AEIPLLFNIVVMLERQSRVCSRHCCSKDQYLICFVSVICMQYLCTRPFWICYSLPLQWQEINAVKLQAADIFAEVELFKVTAPCRNAFFFKCFRFFKVYSFASYLTCSANWQFAKVNAVDIVVAADIRIVQRQCRHEVLVHFRECFIGAIIFQHFVDACHPLAVAICCQRSEEHTSELQSRENLVCRLLL